MEDKSYFEGLKEAIKTAMNKEEIDDIGQHVEDYVDRLEEHEHEEINQLLNDKKEELDENINNSHVRFNRLKQWSDEHSGFLNTTKKLALVGVVAAASYGIGNHFANGSSSENSSSDIQTVDIYGEADDSHSYNINVNEELEDHLAEFRAEGLALGMSQEDLDKDALLDFAYTMNMDEWNSKDIAAIEGFNTNKENIKDGYLYTSGVLSEDYGSVRPDTIPDLSHIITSNEEREIIDKFYELMANFNAAMDKNDLESAKKTAAEYNKLIEDFWSTNAHTKVNSQTAAFVARLNKEARMVTRNLDPELQIFRDDVFAFAAEGQQMGTCTTECQIEIDEAVKNGADQTEISSIRIAHEKLAVALSELEEKDADVDEYKTMIAKGEYAGLAEEMITYNQLLLNIQTKTDALIAENNIQFVANPDRNMFNKKYNASGSQVESYSGPTETAPNGQQVVVGHDNAPTQVDKDAIKNETEEKLKQENDNAPITPAPGINIDGNGNITTDDGHKVELNPGGAYDPNIPMWDGKDHPTIDESGTPVEFEPVEENENTETLSDGSQVYVNNSNENLTKQQEDEIRKQIEAEIAEWNAQQQVQPTSYAQSISELESAKGALLEAAAAESVNEVSQEGMTR